MARKPRELDLRQLKLAARNYHDMLSTYAPNDEFDALRRVCDSVASDITKFEMITDKANFAELRRHVTQLVNIADAIKRLDDILSVEEERLF